MIGAMVFYQERLLRFLPAELPPLSHLWVKQRVLWELGKLVTENLA
jgi:hypothetical protein